MPIHHWTMAREVLTLRSGPGHVERELGVRDRLSGGYARKVECHQGAHSGPAFLISRAASKHELA